MWKDRPAEQRFQIRRYDRDVCVFRVCEFTDLRPGDIYAAYTPDGARRIDPSGAVIRVLSQPIRDEANGQGYTVLGEHGRLQDHLRAISH